MKMKYLTPGLEPDDPGRGISAGLLRSDVMFGRSVVLTSLCLFLLGASAAAAQDAPKLKLVETIQFQNGYIDDQFSVSPDGQRLAYVTVKQNGTATLVLRDLAGKGEKTADLSKITDEPAQVFFLPGGSEVVVAARTDKTTYVIFDAEGKEITQIKGQDHLSWRIAGKDLQLIAYRLDKTSTTISHTVTLFEAGNPRKAAKTVTLRTDAANRLTVKPDNLEVMYLMPDFTKAVVKIIGGYNKATDSKFPDNQGLYDLETGTVQKVGLISNNAAWDRDAAWYARNWRQKTPVRLNGVPTVTGIDGTFQVGQGILQWKDITPKFQLGRFDFSSFFAAPFQYVDNAVLFAMSIHPQNPVTLQYKKSEKRSWHFFRLNTETGAADDLGQVQAEESTITWNLGGKILGVMRLSPNWQVGSETLELYQLP
jgi:hypothetical protein